MGLCGPYHLVCTYPDVAIHAAYPSADHLVHVSRTTIEICTAIIAASFPCLKPLFKTLFDGSSARISGYGSGYKGYVRDTNNGTKSGNRNTLRSKGTVTVTAGGNDTEFELYGGKKFSTDVKAGNASSTSMGSEASILKETTKGNGITKTTSVCVSSVRDEETGR